jgi:hypothetical protein
VGTQNVDKIVNVTKIKFIVDKIAFMVEFGILEAF